MKNGQFAKAYLSLLTSDELNDGKLRTLLYMMAHGHHKLFFGSQENIADALRKSRRAIIYHYDSLEKKKFIILNRRNNRTSEVSFSTKAVPTQENSTQTESSFTGIDNYNIISSNNKLVTDCNMLAEIFENVCKIEAYGQIKLWISCFEELRFLEYSISDILDVIYFISNNEFYSRTVHSPFRLLEFDKHGTLWMERLLRESKK